MRKLYWALFLGLAVLLAPTAALAQSGGNQTRDAGVAQQIANTLKESGQLSSYRVEVVCQDGVAWLKGSVTDPAQAAAAVRLAKQVSGVEHVVSKLEIENAGAEQLPPEEAAGGLLLSLMGDEDASSPSDVQPAQLEETVAPQLQPVPQRQAASPRQPPSQMPRQMRRGMPVPMARTAARPMPQGQRQAPRQGVQPVQCYGGGGGGYAGAPGGTPNGYPQAAGQGGARGVSYDSPNMPGYAWPSYAAHPNYAAVTYPKQYSPTAWPYIGPFYPYPQVPLGWRKGALEWDDGWWHLDFSHHQCH